MELIKSKKNQEHTVMGSAAIIQLHVQERNLATEPSRWPGQSYGTVFLQQFVKQTLLARSSANSKLTFFYVL